MINVFDYTDYKDYLKDYYDEKKKDNPGYSYQVLANRAGFKNRGFVYNIVKGNKNLSRPNCYRLSEALGHNKYETEYFENLVAFNKSRNIKERTHFFEKLNDIKNRGKGYSKAQLVRKDQYEFYSKWYYCAIRSIIDMYPFKDDYKWLARMVSPHILPKQAKKGVDLLKKLNMITKNRNGTYRLTNKNITTGSDIISLAVQNLHIDFTSLAKKALLELPKEKRNITGLTLGISEESYKEICRETLKFQQKIMEIADSDDCADRAYQYNFHIFPLSGTDRERNKK